MTSSQTRSDCPDTRKPMAEEIDRQFQSMEEISESTQKILDERASLLAERGARRKIESKKSTFVEFLLSKEHFLVPVSALSRILKHRALGAVPQSHSDLMGTLYERGTIWSIYSLRAGLQLAEEDSKKPSSRVILLRDETRRIGFLADAVAGIRRVDLELMAWEEHQGLVSTMVRGLVDGRFAVIDEFSLLNHFSRSGVQ